MAGPLPGCRLAEFGAGLERVIRNRSLDQPPPPALSSRWEGPQVACGRAASAGRIRRYSQVVHLTRFVILMVALGVVFQPLFAATQGVCECCPPAGVEADTFSDGGALPDTPAEGCCPLTGDSPKDRPGTSPSHQDQPVEPEHPDGGCSCPKSCCATSSKAPLATAAPESSADWPDEAEPWLEDASDLHPNPATSRLKRPPRANA